MVEDVLDTIKWIGHASFRIDDVMTIYIDPWKLYRHLAADIILITHAHYDHYSPGDISQISNEKTTLVTPFELNDSFPGEHKVIHPGETIVVKEYTIEALPAYNIDKTFHPQSNKWVGYLITLSDGTKVYHTGDSDFIPEMKSVKADIIFLSIGGTFTMNVEEGAALVNEINPQIAIPMHFGDVVGSRGDAEKFKSLVQSKVVILEPDE